MPSLYRLLYTLWYLQKDCLVVLIDNKGLSVGITIKYSAAYALQIKIAGKKPAIFI